MKAVRFEVMLDDAADPTDFQMALAHVRGVRGSRLLSADLPGSSVVYCRDCDSIHAVGYHPGKKACHCGNPSDTRRSHCESYCVNRGEFREASVE